MSDSHHWREGETVERTIETLDDGGVGQTADGLSVPGTFPGERVEARVLHVNKSRGRRPTVHGKPLTIQERHPRRRLTPCPNARRPEAPKEGGRCDGCPMMALDETGQRALKRERLQREYGLAVETIHAAPAPLGYRFSSKRVAFGGPGRLGLGSWQRGSHEPASMTGCLVDHPAITRAIDELEAVAQEQGVAAYDERKGEGSLRYVWAKTDGQKVLLNLVTADDDRAAVQRLADALRLPAGVAWSQQASQGNAMRGSEPVTLRGASTLRVPFGDGAVVVGPDGFLQPNPEAVAAIYRALLAGPGGEALSGALAFDLYAGAGLTTARLAQRFGTTEACETHPESAAALGIEPESTEAFLARKVGGPVPDLVVANPPRAGLRADTCARLLELGAPRVHIMSCGPAGLARDLERLGASYEVERIEAWDTLPQTPHVELVAWLRRVEPTA